MKKSSIFRCVYKVVFRFHGNRFKQMHFGGVFCTHMKSDGSFFPVVPSLPFLFSVSKLVRPVCIARCYFALRMLRMDSTWISRTTRCQKEEKSDENSPYWRIVKKGNQNSRESKNKRKCVVTKTRNDLKWPTMIYNDLQWSTKTYYELLGAKMS